MTPEERIAEIDRHASAAAPGTTVSITSYDLLWLCLRATEVEQAKRAGAEEAMRGMRDWCAKQEESATEERRRADSMGWYEAERELEDFRKTYQKVLGHIEQRLAALRDSNAAVAYDANGNPRTTPVRHSVKCPRVVGCQPCTCDDDPNPESETP
jgi:leucyl aminopeptidase (aminopeptidase T)